MDMYILHQDSGTYYNINAHRPMIDLFLLFCFYYLFPFVYFVSSSTLPSYLYSCQLVRGTDF